MTETNQILLTSTEPSPALQEFMVTIFDEFYLDYGKKFTDMWGGVDPEKFRMHWSRQLIGYTPRELKRGYAESKKLDWPPSLPQFKKLCRPDIDPLVAYYEAMEGCQQRAKGEIGTWSHPAIFWAAVPIAYDLLNQSYSQMKARWEAAFKSEMEKGQWAEITKPVLAIAPPPKTKEANREAGKVLKQIGASGMLKVEKEHTLWYRKILERVKNGDKTVTMIQRTFAEQAAREHGYEQ